MNILVIGDSCLDHYVFGDINRKSPEDPNVSILDITREEYRLGGALNVANNLTSLEPTNWVSIASIYSEYTRNKLDGLGIDTVGGHFFDDSWSPSSDELIKKRFIDNRTQKQILRVDNLRKYRDAELIGFDGLVHNIDYSKYDCIVVSDYCKGTVTNDLIKTLEKVKKLVFLDTKNPNLTAWATLQPIIKINSREYEESICAHSINNLIVTQGAQGCTFYQTSRPTRGCVHHQFPLHEHVDTPDVVGAGDVFLAGLVTKYMATKDFHESIRFANRAACRSVHKQGTTTIYKNEVELR